MKNSVVVFAGRFRHIHADKVMRSDSYYIQLANRILRLMMRNKSAVKSFDSELLVTMAVRATAYFEDVVSRIGLFAAFRKIHLKLSGRKLPFYNLVDNDYFDDEINECDIKFLLWCTIQESVNKNTESDNVYFINPDNALIIVLGEMIAELLYEEYETAPENEELHEFVHGVDHNDFHNIRELLKWIHYDSYLSMNYPKERRYNETAEIMKNEDEFYRANFHALSYGIEMSRIFCRSCSPLAVNAMELLRETTTSEEMLKTLSEIMFRPLVAYRIIEFGDEILKVSPDEKPDEVLEVACYSFNKDLIRDKDKDMLLLSALVRFNGLWLTSGIILFSEVNPDGKKTDLPVASDAPDAPNKEDAEYTYENTMRYTNDKPLVFFKNFNEYVEFRKKVFPSVKDVYDLENTREYAKTGINILLFADPKRGTILVPNVARWIKSPDNPLYNEKEADEYALSILVGTTPMPLSLLTYLLENDLLPDASITSLSNPERGKQIIAENQWFIVRFFQPNLFDGTSMNE